VFDYIEDDIASFRDDREWWKADVCMFVF